MKLKFLNETQDENIRFLNEIIEIINFFNKFTYFQFSTPNKQTMVFFRTRLGKILIWQKCS